MGKVQRFLSCMYERTRHLHSHSLRSANMQNRTGKENVKFKFALDYLIEWYRIMPTRAVQT